MSMTSSPLDRRKVQNGPGSLELKKMSLQTLQDTESLGDSLQAALEVGTFKPILNLVIFLFIYLAYGNAFFTDLNNSSKHDVIFIAEVYVHVCYIIIMIFTYKSSIQRVFCFHNVSILLIASEFNLRFDALSHIYPTMGI